MTTVRGFTALAELIEGFVEREADGVLVLECADVEVAQAAQALADLDARDAADVVLLFTASVAGTIDGYVDGLVLALSAQLAAVDAAHDEAGAPRWPRLPAAVHAGEPCARVQALIAWAAARLPAGEHRLVWALLPAEIVARAGWARLAGELMSAGLPAGVRLVLRDDAAAPGCARQAEAWPDARVLVFRPRVDAAALIEETMDTAHDPQQPPRARMLAALQLSYLDLGHGRLAAAREQFQAVAAFFGETGDPTLQALALGGAAEALGRSGDAAGARVELEHALALATRTGAWAVALNHASSLAALCAGRGLVADAESYHCAAAVTAARIGNRHAQADALEQVGALRAAQGDPAGAVEVWGEAVKLCCEAEYAERLAAVLGRLAAVHRGAGREAEARGCEATAAELRGEVAA